MSTLRLANTRVGYNTNISTGAPAGSNEHLWIAIAVFGFLVLYAAVTIPSDILQDVGWALVLQFLCWSIGFVIFVDTPARQPLRLCDPGLLVFGLLFVYCVYPSLLWCQLQTLPFGVDLSMADASLLFMLHGCFFLGIAVGYRITRSVRPSGIVGAAMRLPSPLPLLALGLSVVGVTTILRVVSGGGLIPNVDYSTNWFAHQNEVATSQLHGGGGYIFVQFLGRLSFYPIMALGIGCGLLLAKALQSRRNVRGTIALIAALEAVAYLLGEGARSPLIISVLLAVLLADAIAGPIKLRFIVPVVAALLAWFWFAGYFRAFREEGLTEATQIAWQNLQQSDEQQASGTEEFTGMLAKEATMIDMYRNESPEGFTYLLHSALSTVPSQLVPQKTTWETTSVELSRRFLGSAADRGAGVAGAAVGDGYRFGGIYGVPLLGLIFGCMVGSVQRWSLKTRYGSQSGDPVLLKLALAASFYSVTYVIVRATLGDMIEYLVYGVILPWLVCNALMRNSLWLHGDVRQQERQGPCEAAGRGAGAYPA